LATQDRKIFYLPDTKLGKNWQIVQTFDHRHLFNVREIESAHYNVHAYQEDECYEEDGTREPISSNTTNKPLNRDDEQGLMFEAANIARLMKETKKHKSVVVRKKKMTHFWSIAAMKKVMLQWRLTVMMNKCKSIFSSILLLYSCPSSLAMLLMWQMSIFLYWTTGDI
jgi:hypothetical protein